MKNNSHQEGEIQNHEVEMPYFVERRSKGISTEQERGKFKGKITTSNVFRLFHRERGTKERTG